MKYDVNLQQVSNSMSTTQNILVALPASLDIDTLASGLALFLSLQQAGKKASIVTEGQILVGHSNLFGVGQIQNKLPQGGGGDFTITLGGVVAPDGTVPTLQNLDWAPSGSEKKDLKLTFHVVPGQKFEPSFVTPAFEGSGFDLIFTIGVINLDALGSIYRDNIQVFSGKQIVNIDKNQGNANFGTSNVVDPAASSLSEMVFQVLSSLNLPVDGDISTNILTGIFTTTSNLQSGNVNADTYEVIATALRFGGKKLASGNTEAPAVGAFNSLNNFTSVPSTTEQPLQQPQSTTPAQDFDISQIIPKTIETTSNESYTVPPVVSENNQQSSANQPSAEETPSGETATSNPESDWLTPKIYKGSSIG